MPVGSPPARSNRPSRSPRPRSVVVGAGFGGLQAARGLARAGHRVTVVDRHNYHTFQPLLYQVATAGLDAESIAYPVRGLLRRNPGMEFRMGEVTGLDLDGRRVLTGDGGEIPFDHLVLAAGAATADFGVPGVSEHALTLKSLSDALRIRAHLLELFEWADSHPGCDRTAATTVVVAGGGPTGVELCGGIVELLAVLPRDHPSLDLSGARVVLVEAADRLLGGFGARSADHARRTLVSRGVEVRLGAGVAAVSAAGVQLTDGSDIATRTLIWTAGVRASPLGSHLPVGATRSGRVPVGPDLSLEGFPDVFVIGDLAEARDRRGRPYPQLAPVAMQQGRYVARAVAARRAGRRPGRFRYLDKGTMATIGRAAAVAELPGGLRFSGRPAWLAWLGLHLLYLIGFRNRAAVLLDWAWSYATYQRSARLILPVPPETAPG